MLDTQFLRSPEGVELMEMIAACDGDALKLHGKVDVSVPIEPYLELYHVRRKAEVKFSRASEMLFTKRGYEQSTSESVAKYKASWAKGMKNVLVLCSGIGGELLEIADVVDSVVAVDSDPEMIACAKWNAEIYGVHNITFICGSVEEFIEQNRESFGVLYIDPDRRDGDQRKVSLRDYQPDILTLLPSLHNMSDSIYIKVTPRVDKKELQKYFPGIGYEFVQEEDTLKECCIKITIDNNRISATRIKGEMISTFDAEDFEVLEVDSEKKYLFEPVAALVRADLVEELRQILDGEIVSVQSNLLFSKGVHDKLQHMWGEFYEVLDVLQADLKQLKKYLKRVNIQNAIVKKANFDGDIEKMKKKLGLPETGPYVLFFTKVDGVNSVVVCKR